MLAIFHDMSRFHWLFTCLPSMRWAIVVVVWCADRIGGNYVFSSHEFVILMLAMFQNVIPHEVSASACSSGVLAIGMFKISKWIIKPDVNLIISNNHISIYIYIIYMFIITPWKTSTVSLSSAACGKLRHWGSLALLSPWRCDWGALGQLECCGFNPSPKKLGKFVEIYGNCEFWCRWPAISLDPGHRDVKCS